MRNVAIFGELIILVVYLPIFTLQGIEGKMFKPMAQTVAFALLGAFILSLTYVPMMSALFLSKKVSFKKNISDKIIGALENLHQRILIRVLQFPKLILIFVLGLFVFSLVIFSRMGGEFIPELPEGDFAVETRVLAGSNLTTSSESILKAAKVL
jgi:heavy metal efflux system protein